MAGNRAIRSALVQRGVDRNEIDRAVQAAGDDAHRAEALAEKLASKLRDREPLTAQRRILGQLLRRGYDHATARAAIARALERTEGGADRLMEGSSDDP
jgi:SOS response regulatory protein OraA/RecX